MIVPGHSGRMDITLVAILGALQGLLQDNTTHSSVFSLFVSIDSSPSTSTVTHTWTHCCSRLCEPGPHSSHTIRSSDHPFNPSNQLGVRVTLC